ncbi:MAG: DUF2059 domain-containing protein [Rhodanobacter sp.]
MNRWTAIAAAALLVATGSAHATTHTHKKTHAHPTHSKQKSKVHAHASHASPAAASPPSEQQVLQLFELMHMSQMFGQMNAQMATVMAQSVPCIPASYWQGFIDTGSIQQLMGRMVPIYQKHFSSGDVDGLLKFYRSPLGQKVIVEMPLTMAEGMKVGQQWGADRGHLMIQRLQQRGSLDGQGQCPAGPAAASSGAAAPLPANSLRPVTPPPALPQAQKH